MTCPGNGTTYRVGVASLSSVHPKAPNCSQMASWTSTLCASAAEYHASIETHLSGVESASTLTTPLSAYGKNCLLIGHRCKQHYDRIVNYQHTES